MSDSKEPTYCLQVGAFLLPQSDFYLQVFLVAPQEQWSFVELLCELL